MTTGARGRGVLLVVALAALVLGWVAPARAADDVAQACTSHAVVVIEPGPGPVPICFDGTISGMQALQLTGVDVATYGFSGQGAAVCAINGVGNPGDASCLIGPGGQYWAYFRAGAGAGAWTYSRGGASATTVSDGSMEGWRYGTGAAPGFPNYCAVVGCAPPPSAPPATDAPSAPAATTPPAGSSAVGATAPGAAGTTVPSKGGEQANAGGSPDPTAATGGTSSTSTTGKHGTANRSDAGDGGVQVAAASASRGGGGDGGSPAGVLVAAAVVAAGVGGGLWLRRRRRGPAPG